MSKETASLLGTESVPEYRDLGTPSIARSVLVLRRNMAARHQYPHARRAVRGWPRWWHKGMNEADEAPLGAWP
ncbi:hypothetical protein EES45_35700 [Streptomyces sp. ADI97-07]|nr:hypothetical protein EES45_35700 [Streptomyces sp. ADI97-07]